MTPVRTGTLALAALLGLGPVVTHSPTTTLAAAVQEGMNTGENDPRKATTIQTASAKLGNVADAVTVRYLNLPWGAQTFGYIENGGNQFYSTRTWPIAHLTLKARAKFFGREFDPGDYVLVIVPKGLAHKMGMQVRSFQPSGDRGTFLVPGNVFTETPDGPILASRPVEFKPGAPQSDAMRISLVAKKNMVEMTINYGDRSFTEKLTLVK
ncbi:MAG: hypothetical protein NZ585_07870 [Chloracidobacterium sp.]|nr:hypothetical protein [Chloracidobacterium sp.]MDW8218072.1 hypothetical protein [Acidobacteriota bacterium]